MLVDQQIGKQFYDATNDLLDMKINQADPSLYTNQFNLLLESPRWTGENGLKILAAKCIPQYLSYFPTLQENALDTHLELLKESRFSKILKSPSWAQSQSTPIVIADPVIEPKGTPPMTSKPTKKKAKRPHSAPQATSAKTSPIIAVTKPVAKPVAKKSKKASKITPKTATAQTAPVPSRKKTNQISLQGLKSAKILLIRERSEFIPNPNSSSRLSVKPLDNVRPPTTRQ
ncbi:hypothetical protein HDV02_003578 [Globomyces sp. JEL0801]|nr:hypothetical protein HDV02_003545 [Globomyces sp. JEL0801]KAJ3000776.1 hypothetical protein HDV02_003578 [Globomyces sp. JEL0801]